MNTTNPWHSHHRANPQALYATMRQQQGPLFKATGPVSGNSVWFAVGYDACTTLLKHPDTVKSIANLPPEAQALYGDAEESPYNTVMRNMLFLDPPDHTRLRALVHKAFTPRRIEDLSASIRRIGENALHAITDASFDLIASYALPLPITVIAELLGVPLPDRDKFRNWVSRMLFNTAMSDMQEAALSFIMYLHELFDARKAAPQDDLITALTQVEDHGDTLSREEMLGMVFLLLTAGHETTVNLIANGMLALITHPDQYDLLQDDLAVLPTAVEELLRFNGPVEIATQRWATAEIAIADRVIRPGDFLAVALIGANRDPAVFANPDTLDLTRSPNKHIAFGAGIHYCLGAPLARLEANIAFEQLMSHFPRLELATTPGALEWNDSMLLHGMKALPVRVRR